jgi:hypothetical protein
MKGRYKVHLPDLMPHLEEYDGIWCKNHTNKWNITPSDVGEYGSHYPLHPGTYVIVKFFENDLNTGYIDRILSDYKDNRDVEAQDCVSPKPALTDRDEQYIIFKTPKNFNIFYVNEDTTNEPNTIYLIYNRDNSPERRTVFKIDESGVSLYTRDNNRIRIKLDENKQIDGNQTNLVKGYKTEHIEGDKDSHFHSNKNEKVNNNANIKIGENYILEVFGNQNISINGSKNTWSGSSINYDAPIINLNCGIATNVPASSPKPNTSVRDLGPGESLEYDFVDSDRQERPLIVGNKCDDATAEYNNSKRDNLNMED